MNNRNIQNRLDNLRQFGNWVRKKAEDRIKGREYSFTRHDFGMLTGVVKLVNWMLPRVGYRQWYRKLVEPWFFGDSSRYRVQSRVVPLNAPVKKSPNAVIPYQLFEEVIDQASFRIALNECFCRKGMGCKDYPIDFGCLFLGEGGRVLDQGEDSVGRTLSTQEAKDYVKRAGEYGLVPMAGYIEIEQKAFGVPPEHRERFLEICFCCPCCCMGLRNLKYFSPKIRHECWINVGYAAKALPTCKGCFDCVSICPVEAVRIKGDKVWVKEDDCIGCGLCQNVCPHNAIRLVQIRPYQGGLLSYFDTLNLDVS